MPAPNWSSDEITRDAEHAALARLAHEMRREADDLLQTDVTSQIGQWLSAESAAVSEALGQEPEAPTQAPARHLRLVQTPIAG